MTVTMSSRRSGEVEVQIRLNQEEHEFASKRAANLRISIAEFVRLAIREALLAEKGKPWMSYIGMIESGDSQSSRSVDELVYGTKD